MAQLSLSSSNAATLVDDRVRGFPAGHAPLALAEIGRQGWKPYDGIMSLPLITLDRAAFAANTRLMMRYVTNHALAIAPHGKTPMSPVLTRRLIDAGAWGTSVADIRQASVMLDAGLDRLIIANEIGGPMAAERLAAMLAHHRDAEVHLFVDSVGLAEALAEAWRKRDGLPPLGILVEVGGARAGARSLDTATAILDTVLAAETPTFRVSGVASYEGALAGPDARETEERIAGLLTLTGDLYRLVRQRVGAARPLIVTAGGSVFFDLVVKALNPVLAGDAHAALVLRSGAIFFHDHGIYVRGLTALDARNGFEIDGKVESAVHGFRPALRVWAEVLSRPEPGLAIAGMGLRDVAIDQGLPQPLALYRNRARLGALDHATTTKLNDQHAFVEIGKDADVQIGDVIEFGLSHPCTCLDRHAMLYEIDDGHTVVAALPSSFG